MKTSIYTLGLFLSAMIFFSCGGKQKEESTEAGPVEQANDNDQDFPTKVLNMTVNGRLVVTIDKVGLSEDTSATLISGYIDKTNASASLNEMSLNLQVTKDGKKKDYEMNIQEDGRVPGVWVAPDADCAFTLVAAKDTFKFGTNLEMALFRFKLQFKPKA